jgi:hypothetical protein
MRSGTAHHLYAVHRVELQSREEHGLQISETVESASVGLAANAAENMRPGYEAKAVWTETKLAGRCARCRSFIMAGDTTHLFRGKTVCEECQ